MHVFKISVLNMMRTKNLHYYFCCIYDCLSCSVSLNPCLVIVKNLQKSVSIVLYLTKIWWNAQFIRFIKMMGKMHQNNILKTRFTKKKSKNRGEKSTTKSIISFYDQNLLFILHLNMFLFRVSYFFFIFGSCSFFILF